MKKLSFTLAEVLITLVIIGVIAAITVPTLMAQYRKKEYVTQLKKSYSSISNAFKLMMARDGVTLLEDSTLFTSINGDSMADGEQHEFMKELGKTFSTTKYYNVDEIPEEEIIAYKSLDGDSTTTTPVTNNRQVIYLNDGSVMYGVFYKNGTSSTNYAAIEAIKAMGGKLEKGMAWIFVDVNGGKKPNQIGRDLFYFVVGNDGTVFPYGSKDVSIYRNGTPDQYYWKNYRCNGNTTNDNWYGVTCTARIIDEGWEMNY